MKPKKHFEMPELFQSRLDQILNHKHPLFRLANKIDWSYFEKEFGALYTEKMGAPAKPIRLMVGLHYLKHTFNESDESVVDRFVENPYWQYFCGFDYFQHDMPIDPSSLTRWRQRVGDDGMEKLLRALMQTAKKSGHLTRHDLKKVNVDSTVQEKAIAFPTDARLYHKMRATLVRAAEARGVALRQNYRRVSKKTLNKQAGYACARQMKRARNQTRKLKTYLGRVYRDIERKVEKPDAELAALLQRAERILTQQKQDKNKIYSVHAPEVECIAKGKAGKHYEFGNKVALAVTSKKNWIVGTLALHGNPYDGHVLDESLKQVKRLTDWYPDEVFGDLHYRKHNHRGPTQVNIVNFRSMKRLTRAARRWFKRRAAIEPTISHMKSDNRMAKNYLKGEEGDRMNALLCACGYNMRKLLKAFLFLRFLERNLKVKIKELFQKYSTSVHQNVLLAFGN